jgi:hypothetical protein
MLFALYMNVHAEEGGEEAIIAKEIEKSGERPLSPYQQEGNASEQSSLMLRNTFAQNLRGGGTWLDCGDGMSFYAEDRRFRCAADAGSYVKGIPRGEDWGTWCKKCGKHKKAQAFFEKNYLKADLYGDTGNFECYNDIFSEKIRKPQPQHWAEKDGWLGWTCSNGVPPLSNQPCCDGYANSVRGFSLAEVEACAEEMVQKGFTVPGYKVERLDSETVKFKTGCP